MRRQVGNAVGYLVAISLILFVLVPFVWPFVSAFGQKPENTSGLYLSAPQYWSMKHFVNAFRPDMGDTAIPLRNSLVTVTSSLLIAVAVCMPAGYGLSRLDFRGKRGLMYGLLLLQIIPSTAIVLPYYLIMRDLKLVNTLLGVMLGLASSQVPFITWVMKGFFDSVPRELEEAAWLDGASLVQTLLNIMLPLALPGIGAAAALAFNGCWGQFFIPMILLSDSDKFLLPLTIFRAMTSYTSMDYGMMNAMGLVYMAPSMIFFLLSRKYLIRGTMAGAMAGL
jgi:ABC-type glycerol-3-phosphate transport system permease component